MAFVDGVSLLELLEDLEHDESAGVAAGVAERDGGMTDMLKWKWSLVTPSSISSSNEI